MPIRGERIDEPFSLEAALRRIEAGEYTIIDANLVARRCRERGGRMAQWCDEIVKLKEENERLKKEIDLLRLEEDFRIMEEQ